MKRIMKFQKINQSQLAIKMEVDKSQVSGYVKKGCSNMRVVERLAHALECSPKGLIVEVDDD